MSESPENVLFYLMAAYYLSHFWYLANGLSAAHHLSRWCLFGVPLVFGVIPLAVVSIVLQYLFWFDGRAYS